jgi:ADP-heptose:LPS heptosyltransferase
VADHHGIAVQDVGPQLFTSEADELWAETFIRPFGQASLILITPFSRLSEKNLPQPLAQEIIDRLRPHFLILELAAGEAVFNGTVPVSPLEGLRKSASLFKHLDCIITVDSFPAHLAAAVGSRAVVLFGPSNPETFGHPTNLNLRPSTCPPCADTSRRAACKKSVCMEEISPERVVDAVNTVLSEAVALEGAPSATQI